MAFRSADALMAAEYAQEEQAMQRDQQKFMEEQAKAQAKAEKKAQGKSLWSSIGGTLGGLALPALATVLTGGAAAPLMAAALAAGGTYAGSKLGQGAHEAQGEGKFGLRGMTGKGGRVKMKQMNFGKGKFMSGKRQQFASQMQAEKDALKEYQDTANELLHQTQLTGALTSGVTAGLGAGMKEGMGALSDKYKYWQAGRDPINKASEAMEVLDMFNLEQMPVDAVPTDVWG
tara:strand:- start:47 stop:739 length:693 start_codon:yes stop_codon:yes gene_type:complete